MAKGCLYANLPLNLNMMDLYPEDGLLPGIETHILHDEESCAKRVFAEETAGFSDHHAVLFCSEQLEGHTEQNDSACSSCDLCDLDTRSDCGPEILIDKTGVGDPECD